MFLHGYSVDSQEARGWQAEVFKRLHTLGSRARFVGVTWHGATGLDYHQAVFYAFQTGDVLLGALSFTQGADVTIAAHSLGNMVVSHAIQSGGLNPDRYYMINGAVPLEAYGADDPGPDEARNMTEAAWRAYAPRLFAANWHALFPSEDARSKLTWKGLFREVALDPGLIHNFYSAEEDVVADADGKTSASVLTTLLQQGFNFAFGAWKAQELVKGVDWGTSFAAAFMERGQAGWGFNARWNLVEPGPSNRPGGAISRRRTPSETLLIEGVELTTKPFFGYFLEQDITARDALIASASMEEPYVRYDLLARALPALSNATAANAMKSLGGERNFPLHSTGKAQDNGRFPSNLDGDWRHSDFKDVALLFTSPMFEAMINRGELDQ